MDRIIGTFAALALGVGITIAAAGGALAQPKDTPCPPASADMAGAQGSEKYTESGQPSGRESGTETANAEMTAEGQAVGSVSGDVKRGGCPDIEELMPEKE